MSENVPSDFVASFTNERLAIIAQALLDECFSTDDDLQSKFDSGYSIGCTRFDRQKNRLKNLAQDHWWLGITDPSNRLVMNIEGAPFRFTRDDYLSPTKVALTAVCETESTQIKKFAREQQTSFNWEDELDNDIESENPVRWRFVIDVNQSAEEDNSRDYEVFFVGYSRHDDPSCIWKLSEHVSGYVTSIDSELAKAVSLSSPKTSIPNTDESKKTHDKNE